MRSKCTANVDKAYTDNTYSGRIVRRSLSSDVSPPEALRLAILHRNPHDAQNISCWGAPMTTGQLWSRLYSRLYSRIHMPIMGQYYGWFRQFR